MAVPADAPFQILERGDADHRRGRHLSTRVTELYDDANAKFKDDYTMNKRLRHENRSGFDRTAEKTDLIKSKLCE